MLVHVLSISAGASIGAPAPLGPRPVVVAAGFAALGHRGRQPGRRLPHRHCRRELPGDAATRPGLAPRADPRLPGRTDHLLELLRRSRRPCSCRAAWVSHSAPRCCTWRARWPSPGSACGRCSISWPDLGELPRGRSIESDRNALCLPRCPSLCRQRPRRAAAIGRAQPGIDAGRAGRAGLRDPGGLVLSEPRRRQRDPPASRMAARARARPHVPHGRLRLVVPHAGAAASARWWCSTRATTCRRPTRCRASSRSCSPSWARCWAWCCRAT